MSRIKSRDLWKRLEYKIYKENGGRGKKKTGKKSDSSDNTCSNLATKYNTEMQPYAPNGP